MAAICAAREHASVTVLEHNDRPGRKLLASGNGKCNLTNLRAEIGNYHTDNPELIRRCLSRFPVSETLRFFRELGLQFRDRDGWIYPASDQSASVLQVLLMEAQHLHVKIKTQEDVTGIKKEADGSFLVSTATWNYPADRVILSCGSPASAVRGSSDTAQRIGQSLGLQTMPFLPSLVPLKIREPFSSKWGGCRVHAGISLLVDGKEVSSDCGEIQLTESGISGIPVFQVSHDAVLGLAEKKKTEAILNFWPDGGGRTSAGENHLVRRVIPCGGTNQKTPVRFLMNPGYLLLCLDLHVKMLRLHQKDLKNRNRLVGCRIDPSVTVTELQPQLPEEVQGFRNRKSAQASADQFRVICVIVSDLCPEVCQIAFSVTGSKQLSSGSVVVLQNSDGSMFPRRADRGH